MLVLARQRDDIVMIGDDIQVQVVDIRGDKVRLGFTTPPDVAVHRKEVYDDIKRGNGGNLSLATISETQQSDVDWWEVQRANFPVVSNSPAGWCVAVAPHNRTRASGKTFLSALSACRKLSEAV